MQNQIMQESLQIFTATSGKPSARVLLDDETTRHIHSTVEPEAEADFFRDTSFWGNCIVFAGMGLGYHLQDKIEAIPPSAQLIVIDYYDMLIEHNLNSTFANIPNQLFYISSSNYKDKISELAKLVKTIPTPLIQAIKHPASYNIHIDFYQKLLSIIHSAIPKRLINKHVSKKALLFHDNFFLQEECRKALLEIDQNEPVLFKTEYLQSGIDYETQLHKTIQAEKPDYILSINMKGFDGNGILSNAASYFDIPVIVWFVDDPHPILLQQGKFINKHMTALCWEKSYIPYLKKQNFNNVEYLPLATDPTIFSSKSQPSPAINLGFIGSAMGGVFLSDIKKKFIWSDTLIPLADKASDIFLENPGISIIKIINDVSEKLSLPLPFSDDRNITWLCSYIIHTASMKKRKMIVSSLLPSGLELFGDPEGWKELLGNTIKVHSNLDYNSQLCSAYRNIEINLNITSCQMPGAVNQRVFDVPMSGGFILSDNQKDLGELFEPGKEAIMYKNIDELKDLVKYYTANKAEKQHIIKAGQKRILDEHTYYHRIKYIQEILKM